MKRISCTDKENIAKVQALEPIAKELDCTVAQLSLAWCLRQPKVSSVIIGARDTKHLDRYAELFRFRLGERDRREIDALRGEMTVPPGDVYDLERDRTGRHGRIMKYNLNAG